MKLFYFCSLLMAIMLVGGCKPAAKTESGEAIVDYNKLRMDVVKAVQSGELKPDADGVVALPEKWADVSQNGEVYTMVSPDLGLLVAFKTMRGRGFGQGVLYTEKALANGASTVSAGALTLTVVGKTSSHWYRVNG
jgi:hypothetical protein